MKIIFIPVALSFLLTGCASLMTQNMSHGDPDADDVAKAAAVDVATAPAQIAIGIPLLASEGIKESKRKKKEKAIDELMVQFQDDAVRKSYIKNLTSQREIWPYFVHESSGVFDAEDLLYFWDYFEPQYGSFFEKKLNTPESILREYYEFLKMTHGETETLKRVLWSHEELVSHPNLSEGIVAEIRLYDDPKLNTYISKRTEPVASGQRR
jgi:hypothetical protein